MYRRERKKHGRKTSEPIAQSSEDGSSGSPARMDTDDGQGPTSSSEEESSADEDTIPIELTPDLKQILEHDYFLINSKSKVSWDAYLILVNYLQYAQNADLHV